MCLLGHSFGGYLSSAYALKYPDRVKHLILADPWGFPERPKDIVQRYNIPWYIRGLFQIFKHFNPLAALRLTGPYGQRTIQRARPELLRKFESIFDTEEENFEVVSNYMFHSNAQDPTGESAFHSLMEGFAWAKTPMFPRLAKLDPNIPVTALYGGNSWVSSISEDDFVNTANRETSYTRVKIIENASHHVYADQVVEFNREVLDACNISESDEKVSSRSADAHQGRDNPDAFKNMEGLRAFNKK